MDSGINIDIMSARAVNERLPALADQISIAMNTLSSLRSSIDTRVLDRANLRTRLRNAQSGIEATESDLLLLHRAVAQNINSYEENEMRLLQKIKGASSKI